MTNALALQHNKKEKNIHEMYKTYTLSFAGGKTVQYPQYINTYAQMISDHKPKLGQSDLVYWVCGSSCFVLSAGRHGPWAACQ